MRFWNRSTPKKKEVALTTNYPATVEIEYTRPDGVVCNCTINQPWRIHHTWYSSKRNALGKFEKHPVTYLAAFLALLKKGKCTKITSVLKFVEA